MFYHFSVAPDFKGEFLDGSLAESDSGPGVKGFGFVSEEKGGAAG